MQTPVLIITGTVVFAATGIAIPAYIAWPGTLAMALKRKADWILKEGEDKCRALFVTSI